MLFCPSDLCALTSAVSFTQKAPLMRNSVRDPSGTTSWKPSGSSCSPGYGQTCPTFTLFCLCTYILYCSHLSSYLFLHESVCSLAVDSVLHSSPRSTGFRYYVSSEQFILKFPEFFCIGSSHMLQTKSPLKI